MKKYSVTINGTTYIAEVEELEAGASVAAPVAAPAAAPKAAAPAAPKATVPAGATAVKAPMQGTVKKVNVKVGQAVKKGDTLLVFEAMKMDNEISAPADGTVASVNVNEGAAIKADDVVITLK